MCNTLAGTKIFGFQTEMSSYHCDNDKLLKSDIASKKVDRTIVSVSCRNFIKKSQVDE